LIAMAMLATGHLLDDLDLGLSAEFITYLPIRYTIVLPIALFYIVEFLLNPTYQLHKQDYWFLAPLLVQIVINVTFFFIYLR